MWIFHCAEAGWKCRFYLSKVFNRFFPGINTRATNLSCINAVVNSLWHSLPANCNDFQNLAEIQVMVTFHNFPYFLLSICANVMQGTYKASFLPLLHDCLSFSYNKSTHACCNDNLSEFISWSMWQSDVLMNHCHWYLTNRRRILWSSDIIWHYDTAEGHQEHICAPCC